MVTFPNIDVEAGTVLLAPKAGVAALDPNTDGDAGFVEAFEPNIDEDEDTVVDAPKIEVPVDLKIDDPGAVVVETTVLPNIDGVDAAELLTANKGDDDFVEGIEAASNIEPVLVGLSPNNGVVLEGTLAANMLVAAEPPKIELVVVAPKIEPPEEVVGTNKDAFVVTIELDEDIDIELVVTLGKIAEDVVLATGADIELDTDAVAVDGFGKNECSDGELFCSTEKLGTVVAVTVAVVE